MRATDSHESQSVPSPEKSSRQGIWDSRIQMDLSQVVGCILRGTPVIPRGQETSPKTSLQNSHPQTLSGPLWLKVQSRSGRRSTIATSIVFLFRVCFHEVSSTIGGPNFIHPPHLKIPSLEWGAYKRGVPYKIPAAGGFRIYTPRPLPLERCLLGPNGPRGGVYNCSLEP